MEIFDLKSRDEAAQLGMKLQRKQYIEHASRGDHSFGDNKFFFRLYAFHTPHVLNSLRVWTHQSNDVSCPCHVSHIICYFSTDTSS
jgi:hypothetical protein